MFTRFRGTIGDGERPAAKWSEYPNVERYEIGDRLYLFVNKNRQAATCMINSHGSQRVFNNTFVVPDGTDVRFYAPDGSLLVSERSRRTREEPIVTDVSLEHIALGRAQPYEDPIPAGEKCKDYNLTKYEGEDTVLGYDIAHFLNGNEGARDIVTLRHRIGRPDYTLAKTIRSLREAGLRYTEIHCCFCRVPTLSFPFWDRDEPGWLVGEGRGRPVIRRR